MFAEPFFINMPILPGKVNIGKNIKELMATGRSRKQGIAIALESVRKGARADKVAQVKALTK